MELYSGAKMVNEKDLKTKYLRSKNREFTVHNTILIRLVEGYIYTVYTLKLRNLRCETSLTYNKSTDLKIHVLVHNLKPTSTSLDP
jgi:hypothetical protein